MEKTKKDFDCVQMKDQIQKMIRVDYEAHKHKFTSYSEYMKTRIKENPWASAMMDELCGEKARSS